MSSAQARRIWLRAQRLDEVTPFGSDENATRRAVEHLGYVQIDTINVIERCHHHILFTRIPSYRRAHLEQAQAVDKSVFEYWTHALSYVPTRDLAVFRGFMRRDSDRRTRWYAGVTPADVRRVVRRIAEDGPLTIRDIDDDRLDEEKAHLWASRKPSKRALQVAFYRGQLVISRRQGMLKTYELAARHFGWTAPPAPASERAIAGYVLDRALRAQGIVSLESICHLDAPRKAIVASLIEARIRRRELLEVAIEGAGSQRHWTTPATLDATPLASAPHVHILSPFDPLIIQRRRLALLFGYQHLFEAYVPKERRVLGYFALPVLVGDRIVAAIDLKTDRQSQALLIQQWTWLTPDRRRELKPVIDAALGRFEAFQLAT